MRFNNILVRLVGAVLVSILLNGSVIAAFAHVATVHAASALADARELA